MYPRLQLSADGDWLADYPDPSSYIPPVLQLRRQQQQRLRLRPSARPQDATSHIRSNSQHPSPQATLWTAIDHTPHKPADWVPTVNLREVDLVSKRIGNYQFNPVWGFLADQSWLR